MTKRRINRESKTDVHGKPDRCQRHGAPALSSTNFRQFLIALRLKEVGRKVAASIHTKVSSLRFPKR